MLKGPPPCVKAAYKAHMCQTFVVKIGSTGSDDEQEELRDKFTDALVAEGKVADAYAYVQLNELSRETGLYLVTTTEKALHFAAFKTKLEEKVGRCSPSTKAEWVRPLSVRFQRLFGWGDVSASKADIDEACKNDDQEELKVVVPGCAPLFDLDDDYLPWMLRLAEALRGELLPALGDCVHLFQDNNAPGPCGRNRQHRKPFGRCESCRTMLCEGCMEDQKTESKGQALLLRAVHEAQDGHDWKHAKKAECSFCEEIPAYVCACGAQRCERHRAPKVDIDAPRCKWNKRKDSANPFFYVVDVKCMRAEEKLEWIRQEVGDEADLVGFATAFLDIFGSKIHKTNDQKKAVFDLFAAYSGNPKASPMKESQLPPAERSSFQRVWDKNAPNLCEHCGKALRKGVKDFCSAQCRLAGRIVTCRFCGIEVKNFYCPSCKRGVDVTGPMTDQRSLILRAQEVFWTDATASSSDYEPAWKKQRRS